MDEEELLGIESRLNEDITGGALQLGKKKLQRPPALQSPVSARSFTLHPHSEREPPVQRRRRHPSTPVHPGSSQLRIITDPLHRKRLPQTLAGFFYDDISGENDPDFIDPLGRSVSLVDPSFSFLTNLPGIGNIRLLHSCNGLFLFGHGPDKHDPLNYIVCNPATEQWVAVPSSGWTLPQLEDGEAGLAYIELRTYLLFDPAVSSHFHLVLFVRDGSIFLRVAAVYTYSSETRVWIDRTDEQRQQREGDEHQQLGTFGVVTLTSGTFFSGFLHLAVYHIQKDTGVIVAVDREGKTHKEMCLPEKPGHGGSKPVFIGQSQGCLHCITKHEEGKYLEIMIWVLEDYDKEEWVLKHSVSSSHLFGMNHSVYFDYEMVAIHPDRNLVYIALHLGRELVSYDMDNKKMHAICTLRRIYRRTITPYIPYFTELSVLTNGTETAVPGLSVEELGQDAEELMGHVKRLKKTVERFDL
ncbi:hypothetical protein EJB05_35019, partial [Eragrostis curvula]